jgi:hypothetical protein
MKKCKLVQDAGFSCICGNILDVDIPQKSVDFVTISHLLEHLQNYNEVGTVVRKACRTARQFVFIEGPTFDFDAYLRAREFKFYWSNWRGHPTHVRTDKIISILKAIKCKYNMLVQYPLITSSASSDILPLSTRPEQFEYDPKKHPPKPIKEFDKPIFRSFVIFAWVDGIRRAGLYSGLEKFKVVSG